MVAKTDEVKVEAPNNEACPPAAKLTSKASKKKKPDQPAAEKCEADSKPKLQPKVAPKAKKQKD